MEIGDSIYNVDNSSIFSLNQMHLKLSEMACG